MWYDKNVSETELASRLPVCFSKLQWLPECSQCTYTSTVKSSKVKFGLLCLLTILTVRHWLQAAMCDVIKYPSHKQQNKTLHYPNKISVHRIKTVVLSFHPNFILFWFCFCHGHISFWLYKIPDQNCILVSAFTSNSHLNCPIILLENINWEIIYALALSSQRFVFKRERKLNILN